MPAADPSPFESAEPYYADHRPGYGEAVVDYLSRKFDLDGSASVLDLGCGTGQLAVPLAARAGAVVGMDPNEEMLRHARERAETTGRENVEWVVGWDSDLRAELGPFRLTTMGRSFHWMDQEATLERLRGMTESGGGVALVTDADWLTRGTEEWQAAVYELVAEYLDDVPERTGPVAAYDDPWDELLVEFGFEDVENRQFRFEREWTVDGVVGYVFSLSFCTPATFGDDAGAFEKELRALLRELAEGADERFDQTGHVDVISGCA